METLTTSEPHLPHAIWRFWHHAYRHYRRPLAHGLGFHVPAFPGALLSPNFVLGPRSNFLAANRGEIRHFNEIIPLGHDQRGPAPVGFRLQKQFFLGERRLFPCPLPPGLEIMPLAEAIRGGDVWRVLTDGFGGDAPFLRVLLPFLATLEAEFHTVFLRMEGEAAGVISVGIAGPDAIVLNAAVDSKFRGRGYSHQLTHAARALAFARGATHVFFWTEHAFFGQHADHYQHYRIFERA